jgi:hypothetical protein
LVELTTLKKGIPNMENEKEETKQEVVANADVVVEEEQKEEPKVNYVKERVDRAKKQTTENILKDLGVGTIDDAKKLISEGAKALDEVTKLKAKIEEQEYKSLLNNKRQLLSKILDNEKVFDSDALINYIDLDKVEIENGEIKNSDVIVENLKKAKPNFFGEFKTVSDEYKKGDVNNTKLTALEKQKNGNVTGAINDYLKTILK